MSGAVPTAALMEYLRPEINRPDLFEERSFVVKDVKGPNTQKLVAMQSPNQEIWRKIYSTIGLILLSAAIFITFVSWTDVLRSWFDSFIINPIIEVQLKARIYYALTITAISIFICAIIIYLWLHHYI